MRRFVPLASVALVLAGCGSGGSGGSGESAPGRTVTSPNGGSASSGPITVGAPALLANPGQYQKDIVVVVGRMSEQLGPKVFVLSAGSAQEARQRRGLLVYGAKPPVAKGKDARVQGRVVIVGATTAKRAGLPASKLTPFRNRAAVAASSASAAK